MVFSLIGMAVSLFGIGCINPIAFPWLLASNILVLTLFSGCLYIVGIAYELESLEEGSYAVGSSYVIIGYRIGLLCASGGALYLTLLWDWAVMFKIMSACMAVASGVILLLPEPYKSKAILTERRRQFSQYPSLFQGFWKETLLQPCRVFFIKREWTIILLLIITFKIGDELVRSMEGPFYLSIGFNKADLATASKVWGILSTIAGAFLGGFLLKNKDPYRSLVKTGFLHASTLWCFFFLTLVDKSLFNLYLTVSLQNLTAGMTMTAFISFLWHVCDKRYTAIQYALLWSLFSFKSDLTACCGGLLAAKYSWNTFFAVVGIVSMISSALIWSIISQFQKKSPLEIEV